MPAELLDGGKTPTGIDAPRAAVSERRPAGVAVKDIEALFHAALDLGQAQRRNLLEERERIHPGVRDRVLRLIEAFQDAESFLEHPMIRLGDAGPGSRLGPYFLEEVIGHGGMATVYRGRREDGEFEHAVAVKVIQRGMVPADLIRRFRRERQILAGLDHPGIARLLDGGSAPDGTPFLVMELVDGEPIDRFCERRKLDLPARLRLFLQACDAVSHAHRSLVIHRDLKPANLLVRKDGEVKLIDFGISKILDPNPSKGLGPGDPLSPTLPFLTPGWASPEQLRREAITTATDVYSLGRVLAFLISGQAPQSPTPGEPLEPSMATPWDTEQVSALKEEAAVRGLSPKALKCQLEGDLRAICQKALRLEVSARYPSGEALANDIVAYLEGRPVSARNGSTRYRAGKFVRRHRFVLGLSSAALLLLLSASAVAIDQGRRAQRQQRAAELERQRTSQANTFLTELFSSADPGATADDVTAGDMLERASKRVREAFPDQPEVRQSLALTLGEIYDNLGEFDRSLGLFQEVAKDLQSARIGNPRLTIRTLLGLARSQLRQLQLEESEASARAALRVAQDHLPPTDPLAIEASIGLSRVLLARGHPEDAIGLAQTTLLSLPGAAGEYEVLAGRLVWVQARAWARMGHSALANSLARRSLPLFRHSIGADHPETLSVLQSSADTLRALGRHREAEALYLEVLQARQRRLGGNHPAVAFSLQILGSIAEQRGDLEDAWNLQEEAFAIRQRTLGTDHPLALDSQLRLANLNWRRGELEAAEASARQALGALTEAVPAHHPLRAYPLLVLGRVLMSKGDLVGAEEALEAAIVGFNRSATTDFNGNAAQAGCELAACLHRQGREEEAQELAVRTCRELFNRLDGHGLAAREVELVLRELEQGRSGVEGSRLGDR